jgi:hypothetical protein
VCGSDTKLDNGTDQDEGSSPRVRGGEVAGPGQRIIDVGSSSRERDRFAEVPTNETGDGCIPARAGRMPMYR